ncbi:MAG TPA: 4-alpha-glucanotransferase [Spirochaetia bacterium]|nr:4-alpha-glucanotransferase [Spirochaetia bacterium]
MRVAALDHQLTGISIPVAALRTARGCGVGEFADLAALGQWCRQAGLGLIQLLPVNDTGTNSSPYSALSAFALHPLYLNLGAVPGAERYAAEIADYPGDGRLSYARTLAFKQSIIQRIATDRAGAVDADEEFARWRARNPWVVPYAVFTCRKAASANAPWSTWGDMADPTEEKVRQWWEAHPDDCRPVAWTQYLLEQQLAAASRELQEMGVALKGDLPILMSRESVDVWFERRFFDLSGVAGAPPDMFSPSGQNWGFPVYDWESLGREGYRWWKDRLAQAGKFFHAFRIDHVLGFFRIWRIPQGETSGLLGRFSPSVCFTREELRGLGFDDGRLRWLSVPHIGGEELRSALGPDASRVAERYLLRIGREDLYNIAPPWDSEGAVQGLDEPAPVKGFLLAWHVNRTLLDAGGGRYFPAWYLETKKGFQSLSDDEKKRLRDLAGQKRRESEDGWEKSGRMLLSVVKEAAHMLVCAEDLGDVPTCVPRVLEGLGILGLRILRWAREYRSTPPGQPAPFTPPSAYPELSVCTPSVHDTSTVRGWWEEDPAEREQFFRAMGESGPCPGRMSRPLLERILAHCARAASRLCVFQVQDLLDLDETLWSADPKADRINVPGTVTDENWTWRMPLSVEELGSRSVLTERVRRLTAMRGTR